MVSVSSADMASDHFGNVPFDLNSESSSDEKEKEGGNFNGSSFNGNKHIYLPGPVNATVSHQCKSMPICFDTSQHT